MNISANNRFLNSGELAKAAGVSTDTLRHYERKGVLARPLRGRNGYRFEETERGATIHISTTNSKAVDAIYTFLRFQIKEHKTGDTMRVKQQSQ